MASAWSPPAVRYDIAVRLDTGRQLLEGRAAIGYRSGADSALSALWLHAYPNAFSSHRTVYGREGERHGGDYALRFAPPEDRGWMTLDSARVNGRPAAIHLDETLARVDLPRPLEPGDSCVLDVAFRVHVPSVFDRFGRSGGTYSMGQWYPKIVVYDGDGWARDPYHYFAEFYGEFGDFDVAITLPDDHWVGATGEPVGASGGDNDVPLEYVSTERVAVRMRVATADSLAGRWPEGSLAIRPLAGETVPVSAESGAVWSVPRGAPVHYRYAWGDGPGSERLEADGEGRAGPVRRLIAWDDTTVTDTLRALAATPAPADTALPSLKTLRFRARGVHDFAWVASPRYVRADTTWRGTAVRTLIFAGDTTSWRGALSMTARALERYHHLIGPYVWPWFTAAEAATAGGAMEYPMLIMNDPGLPGGELEWVDATLAHETAHQWFYGMIGNDERRYPWLDEGFAQFLEDDYVDEHYPRGIWRRRGRFRWVAPVRHATNGQRSILRQHAARDAQPPAWPADASASYSRYATAAYNRPAAMLRSLRGVWGPETFRAFLHDLYRRGLGRHLVPGDVYDAARTTAGAGADSLIRPWIETTGLPDVALGPVRRERTADGWRTTVLLRRKGEIAMPIPVEATYEDGARDTVLAFTGEVENRVVLEGPRRVARVRLDPRGDVFDAYPLDNTGRLLPPMRWRPLFDYATPAAVTVLYGPTIWHGTREGMRLGAWVDGRYLPNDDYPYGFRAFEAGLNVGAGDGSVAWRAGYRRRVPALGARGSLRLLASDDAGLARREVSLSNTIKAPGGRHPWRSWRVTFQDLDRDRGDSTAAPGDSSGRRLHRTLSAEISLTIRTLGPRRRESLALSWRHGAAVDDRPGANTARHYDRAEADLRQTLDLGPRASFHVSWRAVAGRSWRAVPYGRLFDPAQATPLETLDRFYWNAGGPLRESGNLWAEGGGGLRGYVGRDLRTDRLVAGSLEIRHDRWPLSLFVDVGRVALARPEIPGPNRRTLADAGIGWNAGFVRIYAPVWVGTPPSDEAPLAARWVVAFDLPDPRFR